MNEQEFITLKLEHDRYRLALRTIHSLAGMMVDQAQSLDQDRLAFDYRMRAEGIRQIIMRTLGENT